MQNNFVTLNTASAAANGIAYVKFFSRSHYSVIRVYDEGNSVTETDPGVTPAIEAVVSDHGLISIMAIFEFHHRLNLPNSIIRKILSPV